MESEAERLIELARAVCGESRRLRWLVRDDLDRLAKEREAVRRVRERIRAERRAIRQGRGLP